jgi:hypothetical protein
MMGLFGTSIDDPRTLGMLQLASGLMSSPRFGQGMSQGLLAYGDTMSRAKQEQAQAKLLQMREEQMAMQMEQQRAEMQQRQAQMQQQQTDQQAMRGMFTPMSGPTQDQGPLMPRFDPRAMLGQGASPEAAMQALKMHTAMQPPEEQVDYKVVGGNLIKIPKRGPIESVFAAPEKPSEQPSSVREYEYAVKQGFKGTYQQFETAMKRAGASNMNVTYGAPVAGVGPDGKPVFFQPSKDGGPPSIVPGVSPQVPPMPASTKEKIAENSVALGKIKQALSRVQSDGNSLGAQNYLGDTIMQRIDPKGVEVRADIADIGSQKIHDRSGAAVTISEAPRLKPFVPQATDTPDTARKKLKRLEQEYEAVNRALMSGATIQQATGAAAPKASGGWSIKPVK